jgi:uncharacterized Zn finger protein (UPF0148 family)
MTEKENNNLKDKCAKCGTPLTEREDYYCAACESVLYGDD